MSYGRGKNPNSRRKPWIMTSERVEWLLRQVGENPNLTRVELAEMFTKEFNATVQPCTIKKALNSRGVKLTRKNSHKSKTTLMNYMNENHTQPIGYERVKNGVTYIKISNNKTSNDYFKENYVEKHRYLWNLWNPNDPIKNFECVVFLDGDKTNFNRDNLYKVSKGIQTGMNKNRLWSNDPQLTLAAIKYMELNIELNRIDCNWKKNKHLMEVFN